MISVFRIPPNGPSEALIFPPANKSSEMRFGFKYVVSPFPIVTADGAVVVRGDTENGNCALVGIDATDGMAINRLAASMAA